MLSSEMPFACVTRCRPLVGCLAVAVATAVSGCSLTKESKHKAANTSNLLPNGTFAKGTSGWSPNVTLGRVVRFHPLRPGGVELVAVHRHGGANGLVEIVSSPAAVHAGRQYVARAQITLAGRSAQKVHVRIFWYPPKGKSVDFTGPPTIAQPGKQRTIELTGVGPNGARKARVAVGAIYGSAQHVAVRVQRVELVPAG